MPEPWRVIQLSMGTHTGTHIDAAAHFLPGGKTIDRYPVERFCVSGIVVPLVPFAFLPLALAGLDGSPIRAVAWL